MKMRLLLTGVILLWGIGAFSQATNWNDQNRYWYYRYRLVNDFLIRGEESPIDCGTATGYSLPAGNTFTSTGLDIEWSDATSYLGWYIGTLATEYRLLADNNQPTETTKQELYYAMKAYERLDRKEERLYHPYLQSADCSEQYLNGIFVRDDVNRDLLQQHPRLIARYSADGSFSMASDYDKYSYGGKQLSDPQTNIYPAQDQVIDLFMGFALVKKCLGNDTYQGYSFRQKAIDYSYAMVNLFDQNFWNARLIDGSHFKNGNLNAELTSYGVARAGGWITEQNHLTRLHALAKAEWDIFADPGGGANVMDVQYFGEHKDYQTGFEQTAAAIASSWEFGLTPIRSDITIPGPFGIGEILIGYRYIYQMSLPGMPIHYPIPPIDLHTWDPPPPTVTLNVTAEMLSYYGLRYNQEFFALLHEYLNDDGCDLTSNLFANFVQGAPCEGPFNNPSDAPLASGVNGWRGYSRWERPLSNDGYIDAENDAPSVGRFNGLDYLLLYNIYRLTRGVGDSPYKNMLNVVSSNDLTTAGKYWSYETLELSGIVKNNASTTTNPVEITANNSIILKPGFKIESGAKARIYIGNYTACNTSIGNNASLREAATTTVEETKEQMQQQAMSSFAAKAREGLDAVTAAYSHYALDSATLASEYMKENNLADKLAVYPNPTSDAFFVSLNLKTDQQVQIILSDAYGGKRRTLFDGHLNSGVNMLSFDISDLQPSILSVEIKSTDINCVKRLVKKDK
ncbi:T9SS type A sorting domain-containing protein [Parachryseolinea silvisoli]|jgi:hypothetical protein|uniref:T9SS type A sorting domain-containing protein n=1 Tax=Parachryseolinea silvisoli TaxID=2873601 RepID=UPI002265D9F4|nr:T9SS type A sorting domain-containing protein [Parachryseolinea silvisoli]MCD9014745.1 T9SS type A sorting domain-containing protein [Parachryseolinea silvisoli]